MHIAYIAADRGTPVFGPKGASVHIRAMVNAFAALGHRVTVLAAVRGQGASRLDAEVIELGEEVPAAMLDSGASDTERRRQRELRLQQIAECLGQRLQRLHQQDPVDLVYERYSLFSTAGVRAAQTFRVPCLVEVNAPLIEEQKTHRLLLHETLALEVRNEVFRRASALLVVSRPLVDYALGAGAERGAIQVIPNGVDTEVFHPSVEPHPLAVSEGRPVIGFSGSLKPWHGLEVLMETMRGLQGEARSPHLLVVGEGPLRSWMEGYACGAGFESRLTITGWVEPDAVAGWLRTMDLALAPYPAEEHFYFSPLKLYEYMAVGTPVIASGLGQIAEILRDGETGLLARPGDVHHLIEQIRRLLTDHALRRDLGQRAARWAAQRNWHHNARQALAIAERSTKAA